MPKDKPSARITFATYKCLCCGFKDKVTGKKEDYSEVKVCPKCNGAFVDMWLMDKYKSSAKGIDNALEKDYTKITLKVDDTIVDEIIDHQDTTLLQIKLDTITSVPRVFYKGEEITKKMRVSFDWETRRDGDKTPTFIHIQHADPLSEDINTMTIQHNQPIE
jgi:NMD protein affecting ribosome stability and mRNA decay